MRIRRLGAGIVSSRIKLGQIRIVDFSAHEPPEMTKRWRPVVVLAETERNLFTCVALSSTPPTVVQGFHHRLSEEAMPIPWRMRPQEIWAKGNHLYSLAERRLERLPIGRVWWSFRLPDAELRAIRRAVRRALGV